MIFTNIQFVAGCLRMNERTGTQNIKLVSTESNRISWKNLLDVDTAGQGFSNTWQQKSDLICAVMWHPVCCEHLSVHSCPMCVCIVLIMSMEDSCCREAFQSSPIVKHSAANTWWRYSAMPANTRLWMNTHSVTNLWVRLSLSVQDIRPTSSSSRGIMIMSGKCLHSGHTVNSNRHNESLTCCLCPWRGVPQRFTAVWLEARLLLITGSGLSNESTHVDEHKDSFLCWCLYLVFSWLSHVRASL